MINPAVTDHLLHELVAGSHAEGTACLAVAAAIEHDDRTLFLATIDDNFETSWELPTDLVRPGETLLQGLARAVGTTGLGVVEVTGYVGHHDRLVGEEVVRTFVFAVVVDDPERVCRWASIGHRWTDEPITAWAIQGEAEGNATSTGVLPGRLIAPSNGPHQLSAALREGAKGLLCAEAAVELLIGQESWLYRADFVDGFIDHWSSADGSQGSAFVDWVKVVEALDAGSLPCSSGEARLLRIAGSLAEGTPIDLHDSISGLDSMNSERVAGAVRHAAGHVPQPPVHAKGPGRPPLF